VLNSNRILGGCPNNGIHQQTRGFLSLTRGFLSCSCIAKEAVGAAAATHHKVNMAAVSEPGTVETVSGESKRQSEPVGPAAGSGCAAGAGPGPGAVPGTSSLPSTESGERALDLTTPAGGVPHAAAAEEKGPGATRVIEHKKIRSDEDRRTHRSHREETKGRHGRPRTEHKVRSGTWMTRDHAYDEGRVARGEYERLQEAEHRSLAWALQASLQDAAAAKKKGVEPAFMSRSTPSLRSTPTVTPTVTHAIVGTGPPSVPATLPATVASVSGGAGEWSTDRGAMGPYSAGAVTLFPPGAGGSVSPKTSPLYGPACAHCQVQPQKKSLYSDAVGADYGVVVAIQTTGADCTHCQIIGFGLTHVDFVQGKIIETYSVERIRLEPGRRWEFPERAGTLYHRPEDPTLRDAMQRMVGTVNRWRAEHDPGKMRRWVFVTGNVADEVSHLNATLNTCGHPALQRFFDGTHRDVFCTKQISGSVALTVSGLNDVTGDMSRHIGRQLLDDINKKAEKRRIRRLKTWTWGAGFAVGAFAVGVMVGCL
jgi:hypothetical protein